jgi:carbon starvation protein
VFNQWVDAALTAVFMVIVVGMLVFGVQAMLRALREQKPTASEVGDDMPGVRPQAT